MKLTKISLAALVALGTFSVASATPLEEAIKGIDVSGSLLYRYDNVTEKETSKDNGKAKEEKDSKGKAKLNAALNFSAALADDFFGVLSTIYTSQDQLGHTLGATGQSKPDAYDVSHTRNHFEIRQFYLGYKADNTTITAGKQELGTFFTDDAVGTGIRVINSDIEGLTLAAVGFGAIENHKIESDGELWSQVRQLNKVKNVKQPPVDAYDIGNLYGLAAIGSYDPVSFQLWYASLENVADLFAVELASDFAISDDLSFGLKGQYVTTDADGEMKKQVKEYSDGDFYAFEATTALYGVDLSAGYVGWKVKTNNKQEKDKAKDGVASFSLEDQGSLIDAGEYNHYDYTWLSGKGGFFFATAGYNFDKFFVGVDYKNGQNKFAAKESAKEKHEEVVGRLSYNYSKKLKFTTWYAATTTKNVGGDKDKKEDGTAYRFQAKYSF
ncbi:major outer membrane protein [Campylobacter pinnipediorum subsp. caledonicus]|uniref:Major outer membrane protein n=1 Tax=Campylobacter pinnipediorum subsp. caledonicus TaxID=1874362 RepID=A0A1S6U6Q3_9BACT|nr:major outer membrane protein [Campylobacter pinnipediorum]AQW87426.1 major outer membrane protein [Campylobacter pinnipediorum subsp. caledonicus]